MATARRLDKLRPIHYKCIELEILHPEWTQGQLAQAVGRKNTAISNWWNSDVYVEARDKRLLEVWHGAVKIAQDTMIELSQNGDFQASKYILDSNNYKPTDKVELNTGDIKIKIED